MFYLGDTSESLPCKLYKLDWRIEWYTDKYQEVWALLVAKAVGINTTLLVQSFLTLEICDNSVLLSLFSLGLLT